MPITRIGTVVPSTPSRTIPLPRPTPVAAANEASMTTPCGWLARSQVPATTSGADIAGSRGVIPSSCTGDFCAPCTMVAGAAS